MDDDIHIRKRMICLDRNGKQTQAEEACAALRDVKGVYDVQPVDYHRLSLTYSLEFLSFELIADLLKELGFYLDDSVPAYIRRTIYEYLEDNAREKMSVDDDNDNRKLICNIDGEQEQDKPEEYWNNYR